MNLSYSFREKLAKRHLAKRIETINGCGVLVLQGGKVLCGTRIERGGKGQICGAGGHVEHGENPQQAAIREAKEEFNIICEELEFLGVQDGGEKYGKSAVFLCRKFYGEPKTDEVEMTEPRWADPSKLKENLFPPFEQSLEFLAEGVAKFNPYHGADGRFTTGSGATSFTIRTKDPSKQHMVGRAVVREAADKIRGLDHEESFIIGADGKMRKYAVGDSGSVSMTVGDKREHAADAVIMHNHPSGGTFSPSDLHDLGYRPSEMRVVTTDGDYVMRGIDGKQNWVGLRDSIEAAEANFKEPYQLRNEIFEQKYRESYDAEVNSVAEKFIRQKESGASEETLNATLSEWKKVETAWLKKHPKEERDAEAERAYLDQYHNHYKEHAAEYGIEYTFEPKIKKYNHNHGADGRFTTGSGSDAAYIKAVNEGDAKKVESMVREAASAKGYTIEAYHGTIVQFSEFEEGGTFFTDDYMVADGFGSGERIISAYLKLENPLVIDCHGQQWDALDSQYGESTRDIVGSLDKQYDGVVFKDINDNIFDDDMVVSTSTVYWIRKPSQAKSADLVTYDDNDEIIPLSERFNDNEKNIYKYNHNHGADGRFTSGDGNLGAYGSMIRKDPPPKKTIKAYKAFIVKDGKLYPPMVANPNAMDTPRGVWLDAQEGTRVGESKTGRPQVKAGGKGTKGGSGTLAYRPGWHLGDIPLATQFYTTNKETGQREMYPNLVFAECEIAADHDYQSEAMSYGYTENGKFRHSYAGLPKVPKDGYYTYRTNPDPTTRPWYITGSMKVGRILTDAEANKLIRDSGAEPMKRKGGELTQEKLDELMGEVKKYNHNHDPKTGRFTSGSSNSNGRRGHVTYQNVDDYVTAEEKQKYGVSKALIMKDTGCSEKEAGDYQMALRMWSVTSVDIRTVQRGEAPDDGRMTIMTVKDATEYGDALEDFISKAPQWDGGTLYRGIEMEDFKGYPIHDYAFLQEGKIIDMGGTSSWSSNRDIADEFTSRRFTGDAVLFVTDDIGAATSIAVHSSIPMQDEVIASKSNKYRVDSVEEYETGWQSVRLVHVSAVTEEPTKQSVQASGNSKVDDFTHLMLGDVKKFNMFHGKDGKFTFSPMKHGNHSTPHFDAPNSRPKSAKRESGETPRHMVGEPLRRVDTDNKRGHLELGEGYHIKDEKDGHILSFRELVARDMGCSEKEAEVHSTAIVSFLGSSATCNDIRACQRGELEGFREKSLRPTAEALDEYLENAPQWNGGAIYRGIGEKGKSFYQHLAVGDVIDMGGASSWSSERSVANNYAGINGELFVVDKPTKGTSTRHLSAFPLENEVTVSSKVTYRVREIEYTKQGQKVTHLVQCRLPVTDGVSKSFDELLIAKYNQNHDPQTGKFTTGSGKKSFEQKKAEAKAKAEAEVAQFMENVKSGSYRKMGEIPDDIQTSKETRGHIETLEGMDFLGDDYDTWDREIIMHDIGCDNDFAGDVIGAIYSFTGTKSDKIRRCERMDEAELSDDDRFYKAKADYLEAYVQNAPQWDGGTLYRGVSRSETLRHYEGLKVGDVIDMGGTSSWSSTRLMAETFQSGKGALMFVTDDPGKAVSVSYFSNHPEEDEVLSSKANRYIVESIDGEEIRVSATK